MGKSLLFDRSKRVIEAARLLIACILTRKGEAVVVMWFGRTQSCFDRDERWLKVSFRKQRIDKKAGTGWIQRTRARKAGESRMMKKGELYGRCERRKWEQHLRPRHDDQLPTHRDERSIFVYTIASYQKLLAFFSPSSLCVDSQCVVKAPQANKMPGQQDARSTTVCNRRNFISLLELVTFSRELIMSE